MVSLQSVWLLLTTCWHAATSLKSCPTAVDDRYSQAGKKLFDAGKYEEAIACLQLAVKKSGIPQSYTNLAAVQMQVHLYTESEKSCHQALEINPRFVPAFEALAAVYQRQGRHVDALDSDHKAFKYSPKDAQYLVRMAEDLQELGRYSRSMLYLDKALQIDPKSNDALVRKSVVLFEETKFVLAANLAHQVLESNPSAGQERTTRRILLAALLSTRRSDLAVLHASQWLSTSASSQDGNCALMNMQKLLNAFDRENDHKVAMQHFFKTLKEKGIPMPNGFHYICSPLMFFYLPCTQEQRIFIASYVASSFSRMMETHRKTYSELIERQPDIYKHLNGSKLRVGFIGSCFHKGQALALYLLRIITKFMDNPDRVIDIYLYSVNYQHDDLTDMFATTVEGRFRNESNRDAEQIAHDVFKDNIQILVDVAGFSSNVVQRTLAMKPAPVQIGYLAFPGTSGADYMDYYICDPIACENDGDFTELLINLPHSFIPPIRELMDTEPISADVLTKEKLNIKEGSFVYCSLSLSTYVDKSTLELWSSILKKTPKSVLWMVLFSNTSEAAVVVQAEKLEIRKRMRWTLDLTYSQMKRFAPNICDLYLDTLIYNDYIRITVAMTFGIPVLTLRGDTMTTRITTSMLYSAGMEKELAATSREKYVEGAVYYYKWPGQLMKVREKLINHKKDRDVPLFNAQVHYVTLSHAFFRAHEKYSKGRKRKFYIEVPGHDEYNTNKRHVTITYGVHIN